MHTYERLINEWEIRAIRQNSRTTINKDKGVKRIIIDDTLHHIN